MEERLVIKWTRDSICSLCIKAVSNIDSEWITVCCDYCICFVVTDTHVSFMDSLDIRGIALCSQTVNGIKVDEMFAECSSLALVEIRSSSVFEVR